MSDIIAIMLSAYNAGYYNLDFDSMQPWFKALHDRLDRK